MGWQNQKSNLDAMLSNSTWAKSPCTLWLSFHICWHITTTGKVKRSQEMVQLNFTLLAYKNIFRNVRQYYYIKGSTYTTLIKALIIHYSFCCFWSHLSCCKCKVWKNWIWHLEGKLILSNILTLIYHYLVEDVWRALIRSVSALAA